MTISGGIKLFKKNKALYKDGTTIVSVTSNNAQANLVLDMSKYTEWVSIGSDDLTTEVLRIIFPQSTTIDRIFLVDINFKQFQVQYWTGSAYANITSNVVSLDGSIASTSITNYDKTTAYFEFDAVTTTIIRIIIDTTQVVDEEKRISRFIATEELGTFSGYPRINSEVFNNNLRQMTNLNFKNKVFKGNETFSFNLDFVTHPDQADIDLSVTLFESNDPFIVWLCGGRFGTSYFRFSKKGFNLNDVYHMQIGGTLNPAYTSNIYVNGINQSISFIESE